MNHVRNATGGLRCGADPRSLRPADRIQDDPDAQTCILCLEAERARDLLPCGHRDRADCLRAAEMTETPDEARRWVTLHRALIRDIFEVDPPSTEPSPAGRAMFRVLESIENDVVHRLDAERHREICPNCEDGYCADCIFLGMTDAEYAAFNEADPGHYARRARRARRST